VRNMPFVLSSRITFESLTCPGVTVTLRRLSPVRRCALERAQASLRAKQRDLMLRYADQIPDPGETAGEPCEKCGHAILARPGDPPEVLKRKAAEQTPLIEEAQALRHEFSIEQLRCYVDKINGLVIDGKDFTVDDVIAEGPVELADEMVSHIEDFQLSPLDSKNSLASTTLEPVAGGPTNSTTVPSAEEKSTGTVETAGSTSLSE
jgi:hypothetical protein